MSAASQNKTDQLEMAGAAAAVAPPQEDQASSLSKILASIEQVNSNQMIMNMRMECMAESLNTITNQVNTITNKPDMGDPARCQQTPTPTYQ